MLSIFPDYLRELTGWALLLRIVLAVVCSGLLGLERERRGRAAGFRTHILVCVGAALVMMTGAYVSELFDGTMDPTRLGAQVISGIGFLGVGTIIVTKSSHVKGLTTAAGLWASACIGLAIGAGFYEGAILGTAAVLITVTALWQVDHRIHPKGRTAGLYLELERTSQLKPLLELLREAGHPAQSVKLERLNRSNGTGVYLVLDNPQRVSSVELIQLVSLAEGLLFVEEID